MNWELREKGDKNPKWRQGSKVAKKILDMSDPGDRYWNVENVQLSRIRASNANMVAYTEICALPVTPLEVEDADKLYTWLMGGSKRDVHQIHGGTGVSPRLLYTYAQITNLAARFEAVRLVTSALLSAMLTQFAGSRFEDHSPVRRRDQETPEQVQTMV